MAREREVCFNRLSSIGLPIFLRAIRITESFQVRFARYLECFHLNVQTVSDEGRKWIILSCLQSGDDWSVRQVFFFFFLVTSKVIIRHFHWRWIFTRDLRFVRFCLTRFENLKEIERNGNLTKIAKLNKIEIYC